MKVKHVLFNVESLGNTKKSLIILKDTIVDKRFNLLAVGEISTTDGGCGFLMFDKKWEIAIFTGDGFTLGGGTSTGGRGYELAKSFLSCLGIGSQLWKEKVDIDEFRKGGEEELQKKLLALSQRIADTLDDRQYRTPIDGEPCL